MEPIQEIINKVSLSTMAKINSAIVRGYQLADSTIQDVSWLKIPSAEAFHQVCYNLAVDYILEQMIQSKHLEDTYLKYALNKQRNCKHSEIAKAGVTITLSSCNYIANMAMLRPAVFRQNLAMLGAYGQIGLDDLDGQHTLKDSFRTEEYNYVIICHKYGISGGVIKPFVYVGVPDRACFDWIESKSMKDILNDFMIVQKPTVEYEEDLAIGKKDDFLRRLNELRGDVHEGKSGTDN